MGAPQPDNWLETHMDKEFVQVAGESQYQRLVDCGVEIWAYQPTMLHAKIITIDRELVTVGSANLNRRSTRHDDEVNLVVIDADLVAILDQHFDLESSEQVTEWMWDRRSSFQRLIEMTSKVFRPMS